MSSITRDVPFAGEAWTVAKPGLDRLDKRILSELQRNVDISIPELGHRVAFRTPRACAGLGGWRIGD